MSLKDILAVTESHNKKQELSEERLFSVVQDLRTMVAFYREYPDLFIDFLAGPDGGPHRFKFYFYQRVFLRVVMRHRYSYSTFPRAWSKSFLSMMVLIVRAILYPNSHLFVTTGGKEQIIKIAPCCCEAA